MRGTVIHKNRRKKLIEMLAQDGFSIGAIMLIADFENDRSRFIQESFFWYLSGIDEPGVIMMLDLEQGETVLFVPDFSIQRNLWATDYISGIASNLSEWGIDRIEFLGAKHTGYSATPLFHFDRYKHLIDYVRTFLARGKPLFTIKPHAIHTLLNQHLVLSGLEAAISNFDVRDLSSYLIQMRRIKDKHEIESIFNAVDITVQAHEAALSTVKNSTREAEIQASAEYVIAGSGADRAFPSIIAAGKSSTILHYTDNSGQVTQDMCVLIDIGAQKNHYCADLARTYPASGKFSSRQKELYQIVLDAQQHVFEWIKPGYWLNNKRYPENSLQHIARAYFKKYGYEQYFIHGIGHMLGLDVHDCDDAQLPLDIGTVFTIEPGLYLANESIGIRIEDNYWLTEKGPICLSEHLPKVITDVEKAIKQRP